MVNNFKYVGHTYPIHDAPQKVRGEVVYASDMKLDNMLYAKLLLSPIAHGKIINIETSRAEKLSGVVKIFSHLNSPDRVYSRYRIIPDQSNSPEDERLFTDKVRFVGDRVAAVVATSFEVAVKAISLIDVQYEILPALVNVEQSLENKSVKIHDSGNLLYEYDLKYGEKGPFSEDDITIETTTQTQKMHHAAMENHAYMANFDSSGKLTIWSSCQGVYGVRTILADLLNLSYNNVRVIKAPIGGSFGGKQEAIFEPVVSFMSKELRRPVKLALNREEAIIATMTRPATKSTITTAVSRDGKIKSCDVTTLFDAGGYATSSVDNGYAMAKKVSRLYRVPQYSHKCKIVYTNTPVAGGARGWGGPEIVAPFEIHMDAVAKALEINPVELRVRNLVHPGDVDKATNFSLGNARVIECLQRGAEEFQWTKRYSRGCVNSSRYKKGVGVACAAHKNGMYGGFPEHSTMTIKMNEDGSFILNGCLHEVGCGTITSIGLIAAEVLDVPLNMITVSEADTENSPYDFGSYGSRVTYICGECAKQTAERVKNKIIESASVIMNTPKQYLYAENGSVFKVNDEREKLTYREVATISKTLNNTDIVVTHTYHGTSNPGAYGAHFAEVEVDSGTGLTRVVDYLAVHDVGKAINPGMVEGQIHGCVQMGIGYALYEELKVAESGKVINNSFKNYHLVNAPDMPTVRVILIEAGGDDGPFEAKSIGEAATVPSAPAVINAVNNALGTALSDMPITPEKILAALKR